MSTVRSTVPVSIMEHDTGGRWFVFTLSLSLVVHAAIIVAYTVWDAQKTAVIEFPEEPIRATLVKLGKPRDQKLLPRLDTAPKPAPQPKDDAVAVPIKDAKEKAPDKRDAKEEEEKRKSAIERIQEQVEHDKAREQALARIAQRVGKAEPEEGQEDGSPQGDSPTPAQGNQYIASLSAAVHKQYLVPSVITPPECAKLKAVVFVRMASDGTVMEAKVEKSSGMDLFDAAVVQATKAASPLPAPPPNMRQWVAHGFAFNFRCDR